MANKPDVEDILCTFTSQNMRILHLIFAYNIERRAHTTECPILKGELMLFMARGCVVDLPLNVFLTLQSEAKITYSAVLPYNLLLTVPPQYGLHERLAMDRSRKSITKAGAQTERPAWVDDMVLELRESMWMIVEPTHMLSKDLHTCLTTLKTNFALTEKGVWEELNAMQM
ncbi:hypothetical protein CJ030_MR7G028074 [Morella rubra]|uniref:Uncharacterized protein n=1 Tax=Morella rubra TaxID=262757 RepID=A0A6A1UZH2_9ROSI|nr:hypothetical protein CJ030_MR7G028074 [Morella rubra]